MNQALLEQFAALAIGYIFGLCSYWVWKRVKDSW